MNIEQVSSSISDWNHRPPPYVLQAGTQSPDQACESELPWDTIKSDPQGQEEILLLIAIWLRENPEGAELLPSSSGQISSILTSIADAQIPKELRDALRDLQEVRHEASKEGFPQPSDAAIENATRLLPEMYHILPRRFEVYPMPGGEIAIDAPSQYERSVVLLCESDGGALCLVNMDGDHRRARYCNAAKTLPDSFLHDALVELRQRDKQIT